MRTGVDPHAESTLEYMTTPPAPPKRMKPFRQWQVLHRHLYTVDHTGPAGNSIRYTLEIDTANGDNEVQVYADGWFQSKHELPASIPVLGGHIEANASLYGVTRMHLVTADGAARRLTPIAGTIEDRRGALDRRHPTISRAMRWAAIAILIANLVLAIPFAIELATELPAIQRNLGTFVSPIQLPAWANTSLMVAGILAATERVLTLRRNRILDMETIWTGL